MVKKVFVGMSGGVDSSVTAALLKREGYKVTGVYMKNWTEDIPGFKCPWQEDYQDALRVAVKLGIDLKVYDFQKEYKQKVVNYMLSEYKAGRTPNPDIMCNQEIKFKLFLDTALENGADLIATGHYSIIKANNLYMSKDKTKDQSYFLYRLTASALQKSIMPIGIMYKKEVRSIAKDLGLATADKKDSQGICFVGKVGIKEFLLNQLGPQPNGPIIDQNNKIIGEHDGAIFYTIGQRHGLNLGGGLPHYVINKEIKSNTIYVTTNLDDNKLWRSEVILKDIHWINNKPKPDKIYHAKLRYRGELIKATLNASTLSLKDPIKGIALGQSAVIYDGELVLGGGIIAN